MRRLLWLPFIVAVSVVPVLWPRPASAADVVALGEDVDMYKNGSAGTPAEPGPSGVSGSKVGPTMPGRAELNAKSYQRRRPCSASPWSGRTTLPGPGWCGRIR